MYGPQGDVEQQRRRAKQDFEDEDIRRGFIRKVMSIVMVQLLVTFGAMAAVQLHEPLRLWMIKNSFLFILAFIVIFITSCAITCCVELRRQTPYNFILLGIFTIAEAVVMSIVTARFPSGVILMAVGLTAIVVFGLTLFAMQTALDFTVCGGALIIFGLVFMIFGLVVMFFPSRSMMYLYASCGVILFSFYLIFDIQIMMGGGREVVISPEDYIFAALSIYMDVITLFLYILTLLGLDD